MPWPNTHIARKQMDNADLAFYAHKFKRTACDCIKGTFSVTAQEKETLNLHKRFIDSTIQQQLLDEDSAVKLHKQVRLCFYSTVL